MQKRIALLPFDSGARSSPYVAIDKASGAGRSQAGIATKTEHRGGLHQRRAALA